MFPSVFQATDGLNLNCHVTSPSNAPARAKVISVHGLGDHSRALPYRNLTSHLTSQGFAVYAFDLRGRGQSAGHRSFVPEWSQLRRDLRAFVELVQGQNENTPLFLVGLSLGGLIALNYAQHYPDGLRGVVAAAPALNESGVPAWLRFFLPLAARIAPRIALNPKLDLTSISRDESAVQEYANDPLVRVRITPRFAVETIKGMKETLEHADRLRLPLLTLHGDADRIVPASSSADFHKAAGSIDKDRRVYPGAHHNLFIETNRREIFRDIQEWMEKRL